MKVGKVRRSDREPMITFGAVLVVLGGLSGYMAYVLSPGADDAFIVFAYARKFAQGHGLVLNPAEYVEGYTCFL